MNIKRAFALLASFATAIASFPTAFAQDDGTIEEIRVTGIRGSLATAVDQRRNSDRLIEVVIAQDIGKLPDQNLAEVLEGVTGVQITRRAGVGTGVQIRGTNANRTEINGVSTVGSGAGRTGINFEDVNATIISAVEVIKSPDAKTIEGSVGGTINLKTVRPLDLDDMLLTIRAQAEDSSLSDEGWQPRLSGAFGDNWDVGGGRLGFVISASYTEQEAVSFRPRTDRDNRVTNVGGNPEEYLGIQFLVQEQENDVYETTNLASTLEWAPTDNLKFHIDAVINEQERRQRSYRLQASGVSALINDSRPTEYETVNFRTGPGVFPAAYRGTIEPNLAVDDDDPNLRFSTDTGSRFTDSEIIALGGLWETDRFSAYAEFATTSSDTVNPNMSTTLNFINPSCPLDGTSNDNCTPFIYDLSGKRLAWGINFDSPFAPTTEDLLDPANVVLDQVIYGDNTTENEENAFRLDFTMHFQGWLNSLDFGGRYNESSSRFENIGDRIGGFSQMVDSPNGLLFEEVITRGPTNYNAADGRNLYIRDFIWVDPDKSINNREETLEIIQNAVIEHDPDSPDILNPTSDENQFYDVSEETTALYLQANFGFGVFRGNLGVRYLETDIDSVAFGPEDENGDRQLQSTKGTYDFVLPRLNLIADVADNWVVRFGYSTDIRRPDFNDLNTAFEFDESENSVVALGNPGLEPEEVDSIDIAVEWYFAPSAVASIGYFRKERTNIFGIDFEGALLVDDPSTTSGFARETDPNCPGGGIYNPTVVPNVLGDPTQLGMCVDLTRPGNDPETTKVDGVEINFVYDLSGFEDSIGWASGFGLQANYTMQEFSGGSIEDCTSGRGLQVLGEDVCQDRGLLDFSETAYNVTLYYEKYNLSARMRYTWREGFRTQDFGGGANTSGSSTFSFPVNTLDRSQLNAAIFYYINDNFDIGIEAVNLTEEPIYQHCVAESGPLCFAGYPDRRIIVGGTYRF